MKTVQTTIALIILLCVAAQTWAGDDLLAFEAHSDSPIILSADKYIGPSSMIHIWAVAGDQTNLLFRQDLGVLDKFEVGYGPGFGMVDDHEELTHHNIEIDHKVVIGQWHWSGYQLAQLKNHDDFVDNALLREQLFYGDSALGMVLEYQFVYGQNPRYYTGVAINLGQTGKLRGNKLFVAANLAKGRELKAIWILEI